MSSNIAEARETIRADVREVTIGHGASVINTEGNCPVCHVFWPCPPIRLAWWMTRLLEARSA